ncbi:hypothetical protein LWM68_06055 [Niabella sp. W65]|nr:hypothetical protein [Niabella sp. W65]MCH7362361.1 hypothetical protein [Niabella sp. W65]
MLYYNIGEFRAAGVTFSTLLDNYPESLVADEYKYMAVKSFYRTAGLTTATKKVERYRK